MTPAAQVGAHELGKPGLFLEGPALVLAELLMSDGAAARYGSRPLRPEEVAVVAAARRQADAERERMLPGLAPERCATVEQVLVSLPLAAEMLHMSTANLRKRAAEFGGRQVLGDRGTWVFDKGRLEVIAAQQVDG